MRVHVTELKDGDCLASDAFNEFNLNVMSKGTILGAYEISILYNHQIDYVDIENAAQQEHDKSVLPATSRTIESSSSPSWLTSVKPLYKSAVAGCESLHRMALIEGQIQEAQVNNFYLPLVNHFQTERDVVSMLLLLNTEDDYTYQHSVQVGMLSYYLASWMGYENEEAIRIGKAGFLHDIGKSKISSSILNKPGKLTAEEFAEIKRHPQYGEEIILASSLNDPLYVTVALQHHERANGSGYPFGLKKDDISHAASIVAVADVYSAMISARVYQDKRDLLFVLRELHRMSFEEMHTETVQVFIKHMISNFIGKHVEMSNGEIGLIVMTHPSEFFRPLVKLKEGFVDLTVERELEIKQVFM